MIFKIDTKPINDALVAVQTAKEATLKADRERNYLMLVMAEENVGRWGVDERNAKIAALMDTCKNAVSDCISQVERARTEFLSLVDVAVQPDGARIDNNDVSVLNADAVNEMDLERMLKKHENNYTMIKVIEAYTKRNNITILNGKRLTFDGTMKEGFLREFGKLFFDKCVSACSIPYGYNAMFVTSRDAVFGMLTGYLLQDCINIDKIRFPGA